MNSKTSAPQYHTAALTTTTGFSIANPTVAMLAYILFFEGRTKESGELRMPIMKEREKFRVASAARNMPRRSSEKHWIRVFCWVLGRRRGFEERREAVATGSTVVRMRAVFRRWGRYVPGVLLKRERGNSAAKYVARVKAAGRKSGRSVIWRRGVGTRAVAPEASLTAVREEVLPSFCFSFEADLTGVEVVGFGTGVSRSVRPLCTHSAIAVMEKLAAMSIALGRYVPMLTNRFEESKR
jgi:hypothetical protein